MIKLGSYRFSITLLSYMHQLLLPWGIYFLLGIGSKTFKDIGRSSVGLLDMPGLLQDAGTQA